MRKLSTNAINAMNSLSGDGKVFLWLIELSHDMFGRLRLVNNNEAIDSGGVTYEPYAFQIVLAEDSGDKIPEMQLIIDNVSREIIDKIRLIPSPMKVEAKLVLADSPNVVEMSFPDMILRRVEFDKLTIAGTLVVDEMLNLRFPEGQVTAREYAGLF